MTDPAPSPKPVGDCTDCGRTMYSPRAGRGWLRHGGHGLCGGCHKRARTAANAGDLEERRAANIAAATEARRKRLAALTTPAPIRDGWKDRAACLTVGPYAFEDPELTRAARAICADCPVARSCVEAALIEEHGQPAAYRAGVRGGTTPRERASVDRLRRKDAA